MEVLKRELQTYEAKRNELVNRSKGKLALVKDDQIIDVFDTQIDAIQQGYERLGNVPFLVKQIIEFDTPLDFTSNLLGI